MDFAGQARSWIGGEEGKDLAYEVAKEALLAYTGEKLAAAAFGLGIKGLRALGAARAAQAAGLIDDAAEALNRDQQMSRFVQVRLASFNLLLLR